MGRTKEPSERNPRNNRKSSEKEGNILPKSEDVTHSCSELTSKMTSRQDVDRVTKRKTKAKEVKDSADCASSVKESISKSQETKTKDQKAMSSEENNGSTFEFSKRLIELAREKQAENSKGKRSKSFSRKRKVSGNGSHDNNGLKRKRQKLSQSVSRSEDFDSTFRSYETKLLNERQTKVWDDKRWSTTASNLALMEFEFSRRLTELSRKRQRSRHEEHAHCCRCVQSFECFWPRSNLQTIRRQGFF